MSDGTTAITGANLIAGSDSAQGSQTFHAHHPATGEDGEVAFCEATGQEVAVAVEAATTAFQQYRSWPSARVARLLHAAAEAIEALSDQLYEIADAETGLGRPRLETERARTCEQLRAFAAHVASGAHVDAIIDHSDPDATPPRPDLRRMRVALGPVAVFGASNFPLAFSVPGGDTASALAAGCPVVIKAHPSHPGTSELSARALIAAAEQVGAPPGIVGMVHGRGPDVGRALVLADGIEAVGFTGSFQAGRELHNLAAARPRPIPVFAEMGSVNPVFITRRALSSRGTQIAQGFAASMTMGTGQFCTKPGLAFVPAGDEAESFIGSLADALGDVGPGVMLNTRIRDALVERLAMTRAVPGVQDLLTSGDSDGPGVRCSPALFAIEWDTFAAHPELAEEHFGPVAIVVRYREGRLKEALNRVDGSLSISVHGEEADFDELLVIRDRLVGRAGRVVWNGFPTGVAVVAAQHHGGPFPATTDPRHTSVGITAIDRFLRPVAFQDMPDALLPQALREDNPLNIRRLVDGTWS